MSNWIFQANPQRYDVFRLHLDAGQPIDGWSIARHAGEVAEDDRAALWVSGAAAGIYALGRVTGAPLEFDDVFADEPIGREELRADPAFGRARIVTQPMAANPFRTSDEEWAVIKRLRGIR